LIIALIKLELNSFIILYSYNRLLFFSKFLTFQIFKLFIEVLLYKIRYTNKYVSLHTNKNYKIMIYKNKECILELSSEMSKIDFKDCYNKVKRAYEIEEDLIIVIIDKKLLTRTQTYYSFFHPLSGKKLDAEKICKNETIAITQNLTSKLAVDNEKFELQTFLTDQGINIFVNLFIQIYVMILIILQIKIYL